jgi:CBS domain-containing protein
MKVSEILKVKGNTLYTITPLHKLSDAIAVMADNDIGSLCVMEHGDLVGMLTFREVLKAIKTQQTSSNEPTVRSVMDDYPITCTPETALNEVRRMMLARHTRYLPVMNAGMLMGVISFYDVARAVFEAQNFENQLLKAYIKDWPSEKDE